MATILVYYASRCKTLQKTNRHCMKLHVVACLIVPQQSTWSTDTFAKLQEMVDFRKSVRGASKQPYIAASVSPETLFHTADYENHPLMLTWFAYSARCH